MRQLKITQSITTRLTASIDKYLQEVSKEKLITAEEEIALAIRIKSGDSKALDLLVKANLRFVVSVAKQYQNQGLPLGDLINDGNLGLIKAAGRFDETRGFKFISFAVWWIRQSIMEGIANQSRIVRVPLNQIGMANKYVNTYTKLEQELGRVPQEIEVMEKMQVERDDVQSVVMCMGKHLSLDMSVSSEDNSTTFMDMMEDSESVSPDESLIEESLQNDVVRVLKSISQREAEVIKMYYGIGQSHAMTLEEIAVKYDLTRERVRQIKEKALRRIRFKEKRNFLSKYL